MAPPQPLVKQQFLSRSLPRLVSHLIQFNLCVCVPHFWLPSFKIELTLSLKKGQRSFSDFKHVSVFPSDKVMQNLEFAAQRQIAGRGKCLVKYRQVFQYTNKFFVIIKKYGPVICRTIMNFLLLFAYVLTVSIGVFEVLAPTFWCWHLATYVLVLRPSVAEAFWRQNVFTPRPFGANILALRNIGSKCF